MFLSSLYRMKFARAAIVFIVPIAVGGFLVAGENQRLTLEDCLQRAIEKNLGYRAARYDPRFATLALHSAYAPYDPALTASVGQAFRVNPRNPYVDPSKFTPTTTSETWNDLYSAGVGGMAPSGLTYGLNANLDRNHVTTIFAPTNKLATSVENSGYTDGVSLDLRQPILKDFWIDGARLNIRLAKNAVKQSEETLRSALFDLCVAVSHNYYDWVGAGEEVAIQRAALDLAERSLVENRLRVEIGSLAPLGEKQSEAQVAFRRSALVSAQERYDRAVNALKGQISDDLAGVDGDSLHPATGLEAVTESFNRQDSWHKALTLRPDIRQHKLTLENWQVTLKYDRNQLFPQLDLIGSYGLLGNQLQLQPVLADIADQGNPRFSYGIELKIPLSNRQARDRHKRDRLQLERELLQYKALEQSAMREVNDLILAATSAQTRIAIAKAAQTYSEVALSVEQSKLELGKGTSFAVVELQRDLVRAQTQYVQAKVDFLKAVIDLARAEGTVLDRLQVNFTVQ